MVLVLAGEFTMGSDKGDDDEATGARIIKRALEEPLRRHATTTGPKASAAVNKGATPK